MQKVDSIFPISINIIWHHILDPYGFGYTQKTMKTDGFQQNSKTALLTVVPFLGNKSILNAITRSPIIQNTFVARQEAHVIVEFRGSLFKNTPLWNNPTIPSPIADNTLKSWVDKGINIVGDLYTEGIFSSFQQLSQKYNLPHHQYLQIRHWVKPNSPNKFLDILEETPLEKQLLNTSTTSVMNMTNLLRNTNGSWI